MLALMSATTAAVEIWQSFLLLAAALWLPFVHIDQFDSVLDLSYIAGWPSLFSEGCQASEVLHDCGCRQRGGICDETVLHATSLLFSL